MASTLVPPSTHTANLIFEPSLHIPAITNSVFQFTAMNTKDKNASSTYLIELFLRKNEITGMKMFINNQVS